jgi:hypothetical protein
MNTCPPRWPARKTLLNGLASVYAADNGTGRTLTAFGTLARRPVPSRWVIDTRCSAMDLNEMRYVKVVVPQPPPSKILDPPTPHRLDERHELFLPRVIFSDASKHLAVQRISPSRDRRKALQNRRFRVAAAHVSTPESARPTRPLANFPGR